MNRLTTYINSLIRFLPESWDALTPTISRKTYAKGEQLLKAGEVCNSLFFIDEGFVRTFRMEDATEVNTSVHFDGEAVTDITSFSTGEPSAYTIEACEDVTVIVLDKAKLDIAGAIAPQIAILGANCLKYITAKLEEHADLVKMYSPSERYDFIAKNKPYILQRVPPHILASYLDIGREKLNSIRKRRLESRSAF